MNDLQQKAQKIVTLFSERGIKLATAESCTAGMIASTIVDIPDASKMLDRGFVTYSNLSKMEMLDVPYKELEEYGAVSKEVARSMAKGAIDHSAADFSIAVTGIAGPSGESEAKPVGLVYIACSDGNKNIEVVQQNYKGTRNTIRREVVLSSLDILLNYVYNRDI